MSYVVLARKYRPQSFADVVQQAHVTRVLCNAVTSDRVAHAILFTGPRGTGKTTVARILAKAMNCAAGPTPTPCNVCRSCGDITAGRAVDVLEIDGASNNGVEQIRELRSNIQYMPAHSRYKIYIIDEVHMLTVAAFNALLKTLEEPPAHVIFLMATTEPKKIPVTILSRCQRHDLKRIDSPHIAAHLRMICDREGIQMADRTIDLVARQGRGSMRDALSLMDQVTAGDREAVDHETVLDILGVYDEAVLPDVSQAILDGDVPAVLEKVNMLYQQGYSMPDLLTNLIAHFRNMLVLKADAGLGHLVDLPEQGVEAIKAQLGSVSPLLLNQILDVLLAAEKTVRWSSRPRLALEVALIKLARIKPALPIDALIRRLDKLQAGMGTSCAGTGGLSERQQTYRSAASSADPAGASAQAEDSAGGGSSDPAADPKVLWSRVMALISEKHPSMAPNLANADLIRLKDDTMEIAVNGSRFNHNRVKRPENLDTLTNVAGSLLGRPVKIVVRQGKAAPGERHEAQPQRSAAEDLKKELLSHPLVAEAIEIFDATLVDVKTP